MTSRPRLSGFSARRSRPAKIQQRTISFPLTCSPAEAIATDEGLPLHADVRMRYERAIAPLRSSVEFRAAEEAGRPLSLDAALDEILNGDPEGT
jgi:hypothetical protein